MNEDKSYQATSQRDDKMYQQRPKIGLALGSGGARGMAHIGVIQVLEEHGIPIDCIAGSSAGALVGSLYSTGLTPKQIKQFASHFPQKYWLDYSMPKMGFIAGDKLKEIVRLLTKNKNIEETQIPLSIVATDLQKGKRKVFNEGPIAEAVRASIAIPGIFVPEKIDGVYYVDGGVIDRVPVSVVKEMGPDIVIAVDVSFVETVHPITSIFDVIAQSIDVMEREILRHQILHADLMIRPKVGHYSTNMFSEVEAIIKEGEEATLEIIPAIKKIIEEWEESKNEAK